MARRPVPDGVAHHKTLNEARSYTSEMIDACFLEFEEVGSNWGVILWRDRSENLPYGGIFRT